MHVLSVKLFCSAVQIDTEAYALHIKVCFMSRLWGKYVML